MQNLFAQLFPNWTILCSFSRSFQRCSVHCGTSSQTSMSQGLIRANYCFAYIKCQTDYRIYNAKYQYSASVCAKSLFPIVPKLDYIICRIACSFQWCTANWGSSSPTSSINKVLIAFAHKNYTPLTSILTMRLCRICLRNCSQTRLYYAVFHALSSFFQYIAAQARKGKVERINKG
jgi:hypothetical protein